MWAALNDSRTRWGDADIFITKHGWAGALTLPWVLSLMEGFYEDHDYKQEAELKLKPNETLNFHTFFGPIRHGGFC